MCLTSRVEAKLDVSLIRDGLDVVLSIRPLDDDDDDGDTCCLIVCRRLCRWFITDDGAFVEVVVTAAPIIDIADVLLEVVALKRRLDCGGFGKDGGTAVVVRTSADLFLAEAILRAELGEEREEEVEDVDAPSIDVAVAAAIISNVSRTINSGSIFWNKFKANDFICNYREPQNKELY